jgi:hypothetical protein
VYQPETLREPAGSVAADLAAHALRRQLTVYAGAGLSVAPPTSLPGASALAQLIVGALNHQVPLEGVDHTDLIAVANAVAKQPLGSDLLRQTMLNVADFRGAAFNYAHEVLALLLCEGAALVLETNYDDCIERAAQPERPSVVRTSSEMLQADGASLLKAHGCATQPETMLVTQSDLDSVPRWASTRVAAQLRSSRVAFIGIGSPADYVSQNVTELIDDVGVAHLLVVDPCLAHWDSGDPPAWRNLLPELPIEHRDERTAQQFCDALLRAYLDSPRRTAVNRVAGMPEVHAQRVGVDSILQTLWSRDAVWVLRWMRAASYGLTPGTSVATSTELTRGLLAGGSLLGDAPVASLRSGGWMFVSCPLPIQVDERPTATTESGGATTLNATVGTPKPVNLPVMLLMSHGSPLGATVDAEARRRVVQARGEDVVPSGVAVVVVAVGHMGPISGEVEVGRGTRIADVLARLPRLAHDGAPANVVSEAQPTHLIDGPTSGSILMVNGDDLIEAA